MMTARRIAATALLISLAAAPLARAQTRDLASPDGRRRVTAVEARTPITVDGRLDEAVWREAVPAGGFVQAEPREGEPASEATDVRVAFDAEAIYLGVYCHDGEPGALIVNDIRKDFAPADQDAFEVIFDTFADRRNGFVFVTNPQGAKADTQIANEGRDVNTSWDAVWTVEARTVEDGWTAEIRIPFKTLRFESGDGRIWGINFARRIRRKNEIDYWAPVPRAYSIYRASLDGNLLGLPDLRQGRNLRVKPFVTASSTRGTGQSRFDGDAAAGLDLKYGVTPALTLDLTLKPDFAQVEADEQQVNLTRFSLFYPEKREFFLENAGIFYFGDIPRNTRATIRFRPPEEELLLFFSRRIGLTDDGEQIPIVAGGRLTGLAGGFGVGAMTIQTEALGDAPSTNYTVLRARRDFLRNSDVGAVFLQRQSTRAGDSNRVGGLDANFRFLGALSVNSFLTKSSTPGAEGSEWAGKGSVGWEDNALHLQYSLLSIGDGFQDDVGFVRRTGIRKHFVDSGFRMRPQALRRHSFREVHPHARFNYYTDLSNVKVTRNDHIATSVYLENGTVFEVSVNPKFERITDPFAIRRTVTIPPGDYGWNEYLFLLESDHSRTLSASIRYTTGGFWSGTQQTANLAMTFKPSYRLLVDVGLQRNAIRLRTPDAHFVTTLLQARTSYSFSTKMFLDSLLQYNADLHQFSANVRFNVIHRPLSDLYVVYNEQQITNGELPAGRALIVKYSHMVSF